VRPVSIVLRVVALAFVLFAWFAIGSGIAMRGVAQPPAAGGSAAASLIAVCVLYTIILTDVVMRW